MTLLSVLVATTRATFQKTDISYARSVTYIKRLMMRTPLLMQHKVPARSRLSSLLTCFQTLFPSIISTSSPLTSDTSCIARSLVEYDLLRSSLIWAACTRHLARTDHRTWVPGRRGLRGPCARAVPFHGTTCVPLCLPPHCFSFPIKLRSDRTGVSASCGKGRR